MVCSSSASSAKSRLDMPRLDWLSSRASAAGRKPSLVLECWASSDVSSIKLFCRLRPRGPDTILPPLMFPSSVFKMSLSSGLAPSTMTPPFRFFHDLATSSSTFSASPSSRHPDPQCLPMNEASSWRAVDVKVRLYFLVNVRKASGRRVGGGRRMGRMAALAGAGAWKGLREWAGVAKAGDDEGMAADETRFLLAKSGAKGFVRLLARAPRSGLFGGCFGVGFCGLRMGIMLLLARLLWVKGRVPMGIEKVVKFVDVLLVW